MSGRKTVLVVDDDPGILHVLANGLSNLLDMFDVVTATNGEEAVEELERRHVDVLVTDLSMPVMDGFALIAYVTNQRSAMPVVVLSGMSSHAMDQRLSGFGGLRVLRKPASYQDVAQCVLEELERVERGHIHGIPLAGVLQLVESERRSCTVIVHSGRRRGHLHFESGKLLNAFSDDFGAEGEAAAYDILSWTDTSLEFAPLPTHVHKLIYTPMQLMLIELAVAQDQARGAEDGAPPLVTDPTPAEEFARQASGETAESKPSPAAEAGAVDEAPAEGGEAATGAEEEAVAIDRPMDSAYDDAAGPTPDGIDEAPAGEPGPEPADEPVAPADEPVAPADEPVAAAGDVPTGVSAAVRTDMPAEEPAATAPGHADDAHVAAMIAAIERLTQRARAADEALEAVAAEVDAFREARRRFDEVQARRERRRQELERFRDEVSQLAREILGRVDGLFDAMVGGTAAPPTEEPGPRP